MSGPPLEGDAPRFPRSSGDDHKDIGWDTLGGDRFEGLSEVGDTLPECGDHDKDPRARWRQDVAGRGPLRHGPETSRRLLVQPSVMMR